MNEPQDHEAAETVQTTSVPAVDLPRLVRLLRKKIRVRKHNKNLYGNTHTATIVGEGTIGSATNAEAAKLKLVERLIRDNRLQIHLPNDQTVPTEGGEKKL